MTLDLRELRKVAEKAIQARSKPILHAHQWRCAFPAFDPPTVLALLDRLEAAGRALEDISDNLGCETPGCACCGGAEAECDVGTAKIALGEARHDHP